MYVLVHTHTPASINGDCSHKTQKHSHKQHNTHLISLVRFSVISFNKVMEYETEVAHIDQFVRDVFSLPVLLFLNDVTAQNSHELLVPVPVDTSHYKKHTQ